MIDYQVVRSARRKTLSLQVRQGKVLVRAPHYVDSNIITALVREKSAWLKAKVIEQSQAKQKSCGFKQGSKLYVLGKLVTLQVSFAKKAATYLLEPPNQEPEIHIVLPKRYAITLNDERLRQFAVKKQLEGYFKQQAQALILSKVNYYSEITQLTPISIKIRQYSARWGSCNSKDELSFNYLMMMLPDYVVDYIVVHELCHLRFLNHSSDFWRLVARHFPNYLQAKQWLKDHQSPLLWKLA